MKYLREFGRQEGLLAFLDDVTEHLYGNAQGVCLTYDRYWRTLAHEEYRRHWPPEFWMRWTHRTHRLAWPHYDDWFRDTLRNYRPPDWDGYCASRGYPRGAAPIIIKILLRTPLREKTDLPNQWEGYPLRYIPEPPCRAFTHTLTAGDDLGQAAPDTLGTLGGILQDTNGTYYLTTAAHVLPGKSDVFLPSPMNAAQPTRIATYADGDLPSPASKCNNRSAPNAVSVDIALCTLDTSAAMPGAPVNGGLARWSTIADMTPGDPIRFAGARTNGTAQIADATLWRDIDVDGQSRCYGDIFVIEPRHTVYLNTRLAKPGDSGAWIIYDGNDPLRAFDGTLIGGSGARVYCSYAENVKAWCDRQFGTNTIILP
jgi:hypothetical protein